MNTETNETHMTVCFDYGLEIITLSSKHKPIDISSQPPGVELVDVNTKAKSGEFKLLFSVDYVKKMIQVVAAERKTIETIPSLKTLVNTFVTQGFTLEEK